MGAILLVFGAVLHGAEPAASNALPPGDHWRRLVVEGRERSYLVHVPKGYDGSKPVPVVLAFHGALMNAASMAFLTQFNDKADEQEFIVAYPNGTGPNERLLVFNAGLLATPVAEGLPDDVRFTESLLNDLAQVARIDQQRIYATGMSNGGMMCYRLSAELSHRIAAIASVAGTLALERYQPKRPVPVLHCHGSDDRIVPAEGPNAETPFFIKFWSVTATMRQCRTANGCRSKPEITRLADMVKDGTSVERHTFVPRQGDAEVILYLIQGGGHTWPGRELPLTGGIVGRVTRDIAATDVIWEFFARHRLPATEN